jgi:hypothetical protein
MPWAATVAAAAAAAAAAVKDPGRKSEVGFNFYFQIYFILCSGSCAGYI